MVNIDDLELLTKIGENETSVGYYDLLNLTDPPLTRAEATKVVLHFDAKGWVTLNWVNDSRLGEIPEVRITEAGAEAIMIWTE